MATGVGLRQILLPQLNKPPVWCKNCGHISCISRVIANFLLKFVNFRYHGNGGRSETKFTTTVKLADPENRVWCKNCGHISCVSRVIANFLFK